MGVNAHAMHSATAMHFVVQHFADIVVVFSRFFKLFISFAIVCRTSL